MSKIDDKQTIYINSRNRQSGTDGDFYYNIGLKPGNEFNRVTLLGAGIPKSYYSVITGRNYFDLTEASGTARITVPIGNYTRQSLASAIQVLLRSESPGGYTYTITYPNTATSSDTGKYTFTVSDNSGDQPSFVFDATTFIDELMGFGSIGIASTHTFSSNTLTSLNVINLQPFSCIQIHCDLVDNGPQVGSADILQHVFANIGSASFSNISYTCQEPESFSHKISNNTTNLSRFYLTDEDNIPIDLNGVNMQLIVMFWKKNETLQHMTDFTTLLTALIDEARHESMNS